MTDEVNPLLQSSQFTNDMFSLGGDLFDSGEFEKALVCFETVIKQQPEHSDALVLHLSTLMMLDRFEEIIQSADHILENKLVSGEDLSLVYLYKGSAHLGLEQYDQTCKWFQLFLDNPGTGLQEEVQKAQWIVDKIC